MQLIASQKRQVTGYPNDLTLNEATCHFSPWSFLRILHIITLCLRWKFIRKKNSINVKEERAFSSEVGARASNVCSPLFLRKHAIHSLLSQLGTIRFASLSPLCPTASERGGIPSRRCPCPGDQTPAAVTWPWGAGQPGVSLAHWRASYPVDPWFDRIQIFHCLEGPGNRLEAFLSQGFFALIFIHGRCQHFCLTNTNKTTNTKAGEIRSLEGENGGLILLWGKTERMRVYSLLC